MKKVLLWFGVILLAICALFIEECARASAQVEKRHRAETEAARARGEALPPPPTCYEATTDVAFRFSTMEEAASCVADSAFANDGFFTCVNALNASKPGHAVAVRAGERFNLVKRDGRERMFLLLQSKDRGDAAWGVASQFKPASCLD